MNQTTSEWEIRSGVVQAVDSDGILFKTDEGTTRFMLDDSGNLLVGHTGSVYNNVNATSTEGISLTENGEIFACSSQSSGVMILNRKSTDGSILAFNKDGTTVGSIGTIAGGYLSISGTTGGRLQINGTDEYAWDTTQFYPVNDNANDLGFITKRWDDIYATNGTIQTSDANEKQQIASLTDAEITAAKGISKLFKTFKWNDSVAEKGDDARIHSGVIAQEVEQAMTDAGLDAGDYGFFISTTWWEAQTEVPATEAKEAYTRTDTYETEEEAPEGATERNRKGIRYPELLSFVSAATEQRLASIEARLHALEG